MSRASTMLFAATLLFVPVFAQDESSVLPLPPNPMQQLTNGNITLNLITLKTSVDPISGEYQLAAIGRILLNEELQQGVVKLEAVISNAGKPHLHGLWFYNVKLQRYCPRPQRIEMIDADRFVHLAEGYAFDFLWESKVDRNKKPTLVFTVSLADGSNKVSIENVFDPFIGTPWFVAGQRYIHGSDSGPITFPAASASVPSGYIQFMTYGCLKRQQDVDYPHGSVVADKTSVDVEIARDQVGCGWHITEPVRLNAWDWTFYPPDLSQLSKCFGTTPVNFTAYQNLGSVPCPCPVEDPARPMLNR